MCHPIFHHFGITSDTTLTPCCLCYRVQAPHSLTLVHVSHAQTFLPTQCSYVRVCVCVCMSLTVLFSHDHPHSLPFTWVSLTLLTITSVTPHTLTHTPHNHLSPLTHTLFTITSVTSHTLTHTPHNHLSHLSHTLSLTHTPSLTLQVSWFGTRPPPVVPSSNRRNAFSRT